MEKGERGGLHIACILVLIFIVGLGSKYVSYVYIASSELNQGLIQCPARCTLCTGMSELASE